MPRLLGTTEDRELNTAAVDSPVSLLLSVSRNLLPRTASMQHTQEQFVAPPPVPSPSFLPGMAYMRQTQEQYVALAPDSNLINLLRSPMRKMFSN